jgi:cytochrome c oxidase subunit I
VLYLIYSIVKGPKAPANPWGATGLEWKIQSPPITHNFHEIPVVTEEAYDYIHAPAPQGPRTGGDL